MTAQRSNYLSPDVTPQLQTRLADWFEGKFDPGGIISRMVLRLDQLAQRRGVSLYPQTNFWALRDIVDANRAHGAAMFPNVDPEHSDLDQAFWILGVDENGAPVTTQAGKLFDCSRKTFKQVIESYEVFYRDPGKAVTPGSYCRIPAEGNELTGGVVLSGTIWVRPDMRGPGDVGIVLSQLLGRLTRVVAISQWWPDYVVAFSSLELHKRGVVKNFGWDHEAFPAEWKLPGFPPYAAGMFWMSRDEMLDWIEAELRRAQAA